MNRSKRLLLGRAGTGKTRRCLDLLARRVREGGAALLLVPTYSQAEHLRLALLRAVSRETDGRAGFDPGCVQTFTSLAERVTGLRVRDLASHALRDRVAADALRPDFERGSSQPGFRAEFLAAVKELKEQGHPDLVDRARQQFPDGSRERKLFESFARYVAALPQPDHEDQQLRARDLLLEAAPRHDALLVDGFHDFTPVQHAIVDALADAADETTVTLPIDPDSDRTIFDTAKRTRDRFAGYERTSLRDNHRASGALAHLERTLFTGAEPAVQTLGANDGLELVQAASDDDEADRLARLVRASGRPFSDFLLVRRHFDGAQSMLRAAFERHNVPLRFFTPDPLGQIPAARAVSLWLRADRAEPLDLLELLHSPYFLRRPPEADVDRWAHAQRTHEECDDFWTPDESDADRPLHERLRRRFGVRDVLLSVPDGDESIARAARLFELLDREARALEDASFEEARDYLLRRIPMLKGSWPDRRYDCVYAVEAMHARQWEKPVVLVSGLTSDTFPKAVREDVFLRDSERASLAEDHGVHLPMRSLREQEERYLFYVAMTRARERLVLSWPGFDEDGGERACSPYVEDACRAFENVPARRVALVEQFARPAEAVTRADLLPIVADGLARAHRGGGELAAALYDKRAVDRRVLGHARRLELVRRLPFRLGDFDPAASLSASKITSFQRCPYLLWVRAMRLDKPRPFELDPRLKGEIMHAALERWAKDGVDVGDAFDTAWADATATMRLGLSDEATRRIARREVMETVSRLAGEPLLHAEKKFAIEVDDVVLRGTIDRVDGYPGGILIRDYKTGNVKKEMTQLDIYLLAEPEARGAVFEWIHRHRTTGFVDPSLGSPAYFGSGKQVEPHTPDELATRRAAARATVASVAAEARAGRLAINPSEPNDCERGKCDGYDLCRVVRARWVRRRAAEAEDV